LQHHHTVAVATTTTITAAATTSPHHQNYTAASTAAATTLSNMGGLSRTRRSGVLMRTSNFIEDPLPNELADAVLLSSSRTWEQERCESDVSDVRDMGEEGK
jgi:hypothetical protein